MPKYGRKRNTRRKRITRRSRRRRSGLKTTRVSQVSFPDRVIVKLPYAYNANTTSALTVYDQVWNLNSLFDPDQTNVGHQPRGFDQWAAIYNRYRVKYVTGILTVRQRASHGIAINLIPTNSAISVASATWYEEYVRSGKPRITSSNQPPATIKFRYNCAAITGVTNMQYMTDDRFQAVIGASPTEAICLHQIVKSLDGATTIDYEYDLRLMYHCEFFDKVDIPSS